ncbi:unnamed protein product [Orchesella dallaii]|uniref:Uncharacterized protein n=1 Tax=Orchesella dallaii TaxID=48710 RepID=A0ABP1RKE0_9HEXA
MSAMEGGATKEILEARSILVDAVLTWLEEESVLVTTVNRLSQEIHDVNQQDPFERLRSVLENPAMETYRKHIATLTKPYFATLGKFNEFAQRLTEFHEMMKDERTKLCEHGAPTLTVGGTLITMSQDINQTIEKWNAKNLLIPTWKTTIGGLVAEWDNELKLEVQESHRNCVSLLDALDTM